MTEIVIPLCNWTKVLVEAIKTAPHGSNLIVDTPEKKELAQRAMIRMDRNDLTVEVRPK